MTPQLSLPEPFREKMIRLLGNEAEALFASYNEPKAVGLRANPLKVDKDELAAMLPYRLRPVPWCADGFVVETGGLSGESGGTADAKPEAEAPGKHPFHAAGLYYLQEPSAMYPAAMLGARPGERVLDLCAAPGGKTTQLGAAMAGEGLLIANEIEQKRAKVLSENVERFGLANCIVLNETPQRLAERFPAYFDRVLVDAPCSGEGMFRKDPETAAHWSEARVASCAKLQAALLDAAAAMLAPGGTLVYSTCTFSPEENEQVIAAFLARRPDMELRPLKPIGGAAPAVPAWAAPDGGAGDGRLACAVRLWPHRVRGEGHFAALMVKRDEPSAAAEFGGKPGRKTGRFAGKRSAKPAQLAAPAKRQLSLYRAFEEAALTRTLNGEFALAGERLYLLPAGCPDLAGLRVVRAGLHLGELKKDRFEPNHALALALPKQAFRHACELTEAGEGAAAAYLRGEELPGSNDRGWLAVTYGGYPLGWGKEVKGVIKNMLPKGLRRRAGFWA